MWQPAGCPVWESDSAESVLTVASLSHLAILHLRSFALVAANFSPMPRHDPKTQGKRETR